MLKLNCVIQTNLKSKNAIINDLIEEFNAIKCELQGDKPPPPPSQPAAANQTDAIANYLTSDSASKVKESEPKTADSVKIADQKTETKAIESSDPSTQQAAGSSVMKDSSNQNRLTAFKFGKNKSDSTAVSAPRKKLEKLDYRSGIDILEIYKSKHSISLKNDEIKNKILIEEFRKSSGMPVFSESHSFVFSKISFIKFFCFFSFLLEANTEVAGKDGESGEAKKIVLDFVEDVIENVRPISKTKRFTPTKRILKRNKSGIGYEKNGAESTSGARLSAEISFREPDESMANEPSIVGGKEVSKSPKDGSKKKTKKILFV